MAERGIDVSYETTRLWRNRFGPEIAKELGNLQTAKGCISRWRFHIDEVYVRIDGIQHYLWRAADHEGEVIDCVVTKKRDRKAAFKLLRKLLKRGMSPSEIMTDKLKSYGAALRDLDYSGDHVSDKGRNNRTENSHQPFRRRERSMQWFRSMGTLKKFVSIHSQIHNNLNNERHF